MFSMCSTAASKKLKIPVKCAVGLCSSVSGRLIEYMRQFHQVLAPVHALFSAGMVLLLNIWGRKRFGSSSDYTRDLSDVHKALEMLKASERRYVRSDSSVA